MMLLQPMQQQGQVHRVLRHSKYTKNTLKYTKIPQNTRKLHKKYTKISSILTDDTVASVMTLIQYLNGGVSPPRQPRRMMARGGKSGGDNVDNQDDDAKQDSGNEGQGEEAVSSAEVQRIESIVCIGCDTHLDLDSPEAPEIRVKCVNIG